MTYPTPKPLMMPSVSRWSEPEKPAVRKRSPMIGLGAAFVVVSAAMAGIFGIATSFADVLSRFLPGVAHGTPRWVGRMGGSDAWQLAVQPVLDMPCWAPFLALAGLFLLVGILRRL